MNVMEFKIARKIINGFDFSQARKRFIGFSDGRKCLLEMLCYPLGRC